MASFCPNVSIVSQYIENRVPSIRRRNAIPSVDMHIIIVVFSRLSAVRSFYTCARVIDTYNTDKERGVIK